MKSDGFFQSIWKNRNPYSLALWPVSAIYCIVTELRRLGYSVNLFPVVEFNRPVIVVGNLTVGGSGKTPFAIWLAEFLKQLGYHPGVVSRGYGRSGTDEATIVHSDSDASEVGDEPLMIARRTEVPVAVAKRRSDAVKLLLRKFNCDVFIGDDGLQHYALKPSLTIVMVDGNERFGNSFCLPAGPLRERSSRVDAFDLKLVKGHGSNGEWTMDIEPVEIINLVSRQSTTDFNALKDRKVAAVCGIRNPQSYFKMLRSHGLTITEFAYPDHHLFHEEDFVRFRESDYVVLMTEKDAVKCEKFAQSHWWYVSVAARPVDGFVRELKNRLLDFPISSAADGSYVS